MSASREAELVVAKDPTELAELAAELAARAIHEAVTTRGVARVALSGGSTPSATYRRLAALALPWDRVEWFWVDERAVPPDHARSNFRAARLDLGDAARAGHVHRMEAERSDRDVAAADYAAALRKSFGVAEAVAFDVLTLGIGDDGHTASLFPGTGAVAVDDRLVASVAAQPDKDLEARLSLTSPVLQRAHLVLVLASGAAKRAVVAKARAAGPEDEVPARLVQRCRGRAVWVVDEAAS